MIGARKSMHTARPAVYLDQWVWIRLASASGGRPRNANDEKVLRAIRDAAAAGVAFPLSPTHYWEIGHIRDPRQRYDLAAVIAPITSMRTFRVQRELVRHQILVALHESVGRPTFRPGAIDVIGLGVNWAFRGVPARLGIVGPDGEAVRSVDPGWLRHLNQVAEAKILAGPTDGEIPALEEYGYLPAWEIDKGPASRIEWERTFSGRLAELNLSRKKLRTYLLARELSHEYSSILSPILSEYRLTLETMFSASSKASSIAKAVAFAEEIPTLRISVEMKMEIFRNRQRPWTSNMLSDIDALSIAVPYCRLVVADKDATSLVVRTGADRRHGTTVISDLAKLPDLLENLVTEAIQLPGDPTGWDEVWPGEGFRLDPLPPLPGVVPAGAEIRWMDSEH